MIDGINVIAENVIHGKTISEIIFAIIGCLFAFVMWYFVSREWMKGTSKILHIFGYITYAVLILVLIVGCILMGIDYNDTHTRYTVTIDDQVGFNEFFETYKIISYSDGVYEIEFLEEGEPSWMESIS